MTQIQAFEAVKASRVMAQPRGFTFVFRVRLPGAAGVVEVRGPGAASLFELRVWGPRGGARANPQRRTPRRPRAWIR